MNWTRLTRLLPSLVAIGALALVLTACDGLSDFGDMNQDPTSTNNLSPGIELSTIQLGTAGSRYEVWRHNLIYTAQIAQQVVHPGGVGAGSQNGYVSSWSGAFFGANYYGGANGNNITANVKNIVNLVNRLEGQPDQVNRLAAARIWKARATHSPGSLWTQGCKDVDEYVDASDIRVFIKSNCERDDESLSRDYAKKLAGRAMERLRELAKSRVYIERRTHRKDGLEYTERRLVLPSDAEIPGGVVTEGSPETDPVTG
jgi:hypothetical protein